MEPLHPELRRELLRVHPELTDLDLDEYERLTALRFTLAPSLSRAAIAEVDLAPAGARCEDPHFAAVERSFIEQRRHATHRDEATPPAARIRIEPQDEDSAGR